MSYRCKCIWCGHWIFMQDDFDDLDDRRCEECRNEEAVNQNRVVMLFDEMEKV